MYDRLSSEAGLCPKIMRAARQLPTGVFYAVLAIGWFGAAQSFALGQVRLCENLVAAAEEVLCFSHSAMTTTLGPVSSAAAQ